MHKHKLFPAEKRIVSREDNSSRIILISVVFFIGCILGAFFGANFPSSASSLVNALTSINNDGGLIQTTFLYIWFHIVAFLLGTSFLGVAFLPPLTLLNGFTFSCASASIISLYSTHGIIMALIIVGIPSLFAVPCFFAVSDNAFFRSGKLLALVRGDHSALARKSDSKLLICFPVLAVGLLAHIKLVPYLLTIIR